MAIVDKGNGIFICDDFAEMIDAIHANVKENGSHIIQADLHRLLMLQWHDALLNKSWRIHLSKVKREMQGSTPHEGLGYFTKYYYSNPNGKIMFNDYLNGPGNSVHPNIIKEWETYCSQVKEVDYVTWLFSSDENNLDA